jgi:hypothetical protein
MGARGRWSLLVGATGLALGLWPVPPGTATAAPVTSASPAARPLARPAAYVPLRGAVHNGPFDTAFNNMDYNGGPVMPSSTDYMVLWSPGGLGAYPSGYVAGLQQYFTDLAHDGGGHKNTNSVSAQYQDLTGAFAKYRIKFGGAIVDTDPYPASQCPAVTPVTNCLTDPQVQAELVKFATAHHYKTDLSHEFFLLTPPHIEGCFTGNAASNPPYGGCSAGEPAAIGLYCAYHENTSISPMLIYANDPYVVGNTGCDDGNHPNGISDGELVGGLSHELNESVTDPVPNDAWTNGAGANQGQEVGDQCAGQMGTPLGTHNGAKYNQVINGHFYWYQEEWSNQSHSCLQRLVPNTARPVAKFTVTAGSGLTLIFDASASNAPSGVADYVFQFNDVNGAQTVEQTAPVISHHFPASGAYSFGLTILASDGTSTGNGGIVTTGQNGVTPGFSFSPTSAVVGQSVKFNGLSSVSNQPVKAYLWEFGDGATGSGGTVAHKYSRKGTFTITLVMFSGVGSAFPGQGAAPISTQTITVT